MATTPSTISTTHGRPRIEVSTPLLVLQMSTTTMPATRTAAIRRTVTLGGGATRPLARRRESRSQARAP